MKMTNRVLNEQEVALNQRAIDNKKTKIVEFEDDLKIAIFKLDFELEHTYKKERAAIEKIKQNLEMRKKIEQQDIEILEKQIKEGVEPKSTQEED